MTERDRERAELLAALHAAGAASEEDEKELEELLRQDPSVEQVVRDFQESMALLGSSVEPLKTPMRTLREVRRKIRHDEGGLVARIRSWFEKD